MEMQVWLLHSIRRYTRNSGVSSEMQTGDTHNALMLSVSTMTFAQMYCQISIQYSIYLPAL